MENNNTGNGANWFWAIVFIFFIVGAFGGAMDKNNNFATQYLHNILHFKQSGLMSNGMKRILSF